MFLEFNNYDEKGLVFFQVKSLQKLENGTILTYTNKDRYLHHPKSTYMIQRQLLAFLTLLSINVMQKEQNKQSRVQIKYPKKIIIKNLVSCHLGFIRQTRNA